MTTSRKKASSKADASSAPVTPPAFVVEMVPLSRLKPHPENYQDHPQDELDQIRASLLEHGFYRNIIIANEDTILGGHGVVLVCRQLTEEGIAGFDVIPCNRKDYAPDDPRAMRILIGDNEIRHLAAVNDRKLSELLKDLAALDDGLLGTGYDEMMLANLVMVTRPKSEIANLDEAAQWVGLPEYDAGEDRIQVVVNFSNEEDRARFFVLLGLDQGSVSGTKASRSVWWPAAKRDDRISLLFTDKRGDALEDDLDQEESLEEYDDEEIEYDDSDE